MVETFDAPMIDFNEDADVPMTGASTENWFHQPLSRMDEDPLEVDMINFDETTEYEMGDEAAVEANVEAEPFISNSIDAEVHDLTIHTLPMHLPTHSLTGHESHAEASEGFQTLPDVPLADASAIEMPQGVNGAVEQNLHTYNTAQVYEEVSSNAELVRHPGSIESTVESLGTEKPEHSGELAALQLSERNEGADIAPLRTLPEHVPIVNHLDGSGQGESLEIHSSGTVHTGLSHDEHELTAGEYHEEEDEPRQEQQSAREQSDDVHSSALPEYSHTEVLPYLEPPPPILLALQVTSTEGDQPEFALFSLPERASAVSDEIDPDAHPVEEPLVLLQHHGSLFYEPISTVFEAFRQEEYFSHLEELSEAEMALNAYDLQCHLMTQLFIRTMFTLVKYHFRTFMQCIRAFISRYNLLRDQITRLAITDETERTHQNEADSAADQGDEHEAQTLVEFSAAQQKLEQDGREESAHGDSEYSKNADQAPNDDNEEQEDADNDEEEPVISEVVQHNSENAYQKLNDEHETQNSLESETGEEANAGEDLDADGVHTPAAEDVQESEENATGYVDAAEPHEEGEEGYGSDFDAEGTDDDTETRDEGEEYIIPDVENELETHASERDAGESSLIRDDAQLISHSTSTSSFETEGSSVEAEVDEVDASPELKEQTDHSSQKITGVFDEEGNFVDDVELRDDDFGDDDFGDDEPGDGDLGNLSEEETIEDPTEVLTEDADAVSQAVLAESEKFVTDLAEGDKTLDTINDNTAYASADARQSRSRASESPINDDVNKGVEPTSSVKHKISKRSLDDAELDEQEFVSPPSSPDAKRARVL
ncbi:hypothetical protein EW145_g1437 [Phellinidium pouzarii]|uniref:Uncharacterized protein n=1 Tax=Phellinidium pouzarii TaxID=167371 RepID=A0A4S4LGC7_9AGAM|nr:hypothetical protein EW145_g1437 [Phellinidium pouzarii]